MVVGIGDTWSLFFLTYQTSAEVGTPYRLFSIREYNLIRVAREPHALVCKRSARITPSLALADVSDVGTARLSQVYTTGEWVIRAVSCWHVKG